MIYQLVVHLHSELPLILRLEFHCWMTVYSIRMFVKDIGIDDTQVEHMNEVMKPRAFLLAIVVVITLVLVEQVHSANVSVGLANRHRTTDFRLASMRVSSFHHCSRRRMNI